MTDSGGDVACLMYSSTVLVSMAPNNVQARLTQLVSAELCPFY